MLTIAPVTFQVVPRITSAPADLVKQRDQADSDARWAAREMVLGSAVSKAGKATMIAGLGVTGLSLLGAPLPLGVGIGMIVGGPVMRGLGAMITMNAFAKLQKASVRSAGLSQQIGPAATGPQLSSLQARFNRAPESPLREKLGRVWDAVGSGTLWGGLTATPALLTAAYGAPGFMAGMVVDLVGFAFLAHDDGGAAMLGGAAFAGISGAVGAAGPWGAAVAAGAGLAMGIANGRSVWKGKSEAWS